MDVPLTNSLLVVSDKRVCFAFSMAHSDTGSVTLTQQYYKKISHQKINDIKIMHVFLLMGLFSYH